MTDKIRIITASIIALAVIISARILSSAWITSHRPNDTIIVTGLAQKDFTSDLITWECSFSRSSPDLISANKNLEKDLQQIKTFLKSNGLNENEFKFSPIHVKRIYKSVYNKEGSIIDEKFEGFSVSQEVKIESKKIEQVETIISKVSELLNIGIELISESPNYFYTQLSSLKIELLEQATKDAHKRAEIIVKNSGGKITNLRKASMGVFQITGQNENENYEWGGAFNTKSKNKTASITVRLEYEL